MIVKQKKLCNAFFRVTMEKEDGELPVPKGTGLLRTPNSVV